jgi:hypothetical protein
MAYVKGSKNVIFGELAQKRVDELLKRKGYFILSAHKVNGGWPCSY